MMKQFKEQQIDMALLWLHDVAEGMTKKYRESHPEWVVTDSPLKYVDWAFNDTVVKSLGLARALNLPRGSKVFEFGPGTGYLLWFLQEIWGCNVFGCDVPDRPLYKEMHQWLDIKTVYDEKIEKGKQMASLAMGLGNFNAEGIADGPKCFDCMIATQISFMDDWDSADFGSFLEECDKYLAQDGQVILFPNPNAFGFVPLEKMVQRAVEDGGPLRPLSYKDLPFLGRGVILGR